MTPSACGIRLHRVRILNIVNMVSKFWFGYDGIPKTWSVDYSLELQPAPQKYFFSFETLSDILFCTYESIQVLVKGNLKVWRNNLKDYSIIVSK